MPGFYDDNGKLVEVSTSMIDPSERERHAPAPVFCPRMQPSIAPPSRFDACTRVIVAAIPAIIGLVLLVVLVAIGIGIGLLLRP